jgi:parvulin-like peptidyl-prolyl isomerase
MRTFTALGLAGVLLAAPTTMFGELVTGIQAVVASSIITYQQVDLSAFQAAQAISQRYGSQPEVYHSKMESLKRDVLETLVDRELILHEFEVSKFTVPETIIDEVIQDEIKRKFADRVQFTKELQAEGMTFEQYRKNKRDEFIEEQMTFTFVPEPIISPHRIEVYYNEHQSQYKLEDQARMRMIVLNQSPNDPAGSAKRRAAEILSQIRGGASFAQMATIYSDGSQRSQGGDTGWQDLSVLLKPLAEAARVLQPGQCSEVLETPEACYLLQVEEKRPAHLTPLDEVRENIERILRAKETDRIRQKWIERLKKKTFVTYF